MRIARLVDGDIEIQVGDRTRECLAVLDPEAPADYRELAALLTSRWAAEPPSRLGIAGGQGSGKSTLADLVEAACVHLGMRVCTLSLDDFYLSKAARRELAVRIHPLFETRGVPGTHDMAACSNAMSALLEEGEAKIPIFDKGIDDRRGVRSVRGPFDLVILEGWCVGARAADAAALASPWNDFEAHRDERGLWRHEVNRSLREVYEPVWEMLDALVYLQVPSLAAVRRWRFEQEQSRPADRRMDRDEVEAFVEYYERITEGMLIDLPERADWVVRLAEDHRIESISVRA